VLSGRRLCDELITRPEESYRLWCVDVCDLENLKNEEAMTRVGSQGHSKKNNNNNKTFMPNILVSIHISPVTVDIHTETFVEMSNFYKTSNMLL
jgi:hypothetical protein